MSDETDQEARCRRARTIRLAGIAWSLMILFMAYEEPRLCGAMVGPVFLFNWLAHRAQFGDVLKRIDQDLYSSRSRPGPNPPI